METIENPSCNFRRNDLGILVIESKKQWNSTIKDLEFYDIYYTYEYCTAFAKWENGKAKLMYYKNDSGIVIYPVILREIFSEHETPIYDIITPYGYGGPLLIGDQEVMKHFRDEFTNYCMNENIVSEVITFHPLFNNATIMSSYCDLQYKGKTTAVNLMNTLSTIRSEYTSMVRRNLLKAHKSGLYCKEVPKNKKHINIFMNLYNETMNRNNAKDFYYFSHNLIEEQLKDTDISKSYLLFVYFEEKVISAVLLFISGNFSHYHLGASKTEYLFLRPNNLLFDHMIEFSKTKNCSYLHLGGGYEENDNLFKYKTSFSNNNNYKYYIGKKIFDRKMYDFLVKEKQQHQDLNENYFPLYRGTL